MISPQRSSYLFTDLYTYWAKLSESALDPLGCFHTLNLAIMMEVMQISDDVDLALITCLVAYCYLQGQSRWICPQLSVLEGSLKSLAVVGLVIQCDNYNCCYKNLEFQKWISLNTAQCYLSLKHPYSPTKLIANNIELFCLRRTMFH